MGKVIDKGIKGPDDPIYREGWGISAVYRPDSGDHQPTEPEKKGARPSDGKLDSAAARSGLGERVADDDDVDV